jgi:hypothetical protein
MNAKYLLHLTVLFVSFLAFSGCTTYELRSHNRIREARASGVGVGTWYYLGSDKKYHYFRVVFFEMTYINYARLRVDELSIKNPTSFAGSRMEGRRINILTGELSKH